MLTGKFIALDNYTKKYLRCHLGNEKRSKKTESKEKEDKIKNSSNNRDNKSKSWFFRKISKIDKFSYNSDGGKSERAHNHELAMYEMIEIIIC